MSPARGRAFCTSALADRFGDRPGLQAIMDTAEIIVSELLTNSVRARCGSTALTLSTHDDCLRIEVDDDAGGVPVQRQAQNKDESGRGLMIVSALAAAWGVESSPMGKRVWADVTL